MSKMFTVPVNPVQNPPSAVTSDQPFLCQLTCQSADIMSSLCGMGVRVNNPKLQGLETCCFF